jgi:hypothetical protein
MAVSSHPERCKRIAGTEMIELLVRHTGRNWIAENDLLSAEAQTLDTLDKKLKTLLVQKGYLENCESVDLFMAFDNSTIPVWMRQYGQHYFNRIVKVKA